MTETSRFAVVGEIASVIRRGSGLLGKSAIILGILMVAIVVVAYRVAGNWAILATPLVGALIYYPWFFYILRFAKSNPDSALLDGRDYTEHHRMLLAAKGQPAMATHVAREATLGIPEPDPTQKEGGKKQ